MCCRLPLILLHPPQLGEPSCHGYHFWCLSPLHLRLPLSACHPLHAQAELDDPRRYVHSGSYVNWLTCPVVTLAELAGKLVAGTSLTSSIRPRRYYKIPKETLEATLDDVEQMINFFVIEVQRIVFAENIPATAAVRYHPNYYLFDHG
jgi:hypothetical protein